MLNRWLSTAIYKSGVKPQDGDLQTTTLQTDNYMTSFTMDYLEKVSSV